MKKYLFLYSLLLSIGGCFTSAAQTKLADFVITGSGQANNSEAMSKAFDGSLTTKWCDNSSAVKYLELIFDDPVEITKMVIQHAQAGGESATYNTSDYKIQFYQAGEWTDIVSITGNTSAKTTHEPAPFSTIALRLQIDKATQSDNGAARIYEFEIYGSSSSAYEAGTPTRRIYPYKVTGSSQNGEGEAMVKAFDGHYKTKWCSTNSGNKWLDMTFNEPVKITKIVVHHAGEGENNPNWNTRNFKFQTKKENSYQDLIAVTGNNSNVSTHVYEGDVSVDNLRLLITQAEQGGSGTARIFDIDLYAEYDEVNSSPAEEGKVYNIFPYTGNKILAVENSSLNNNAKIRAYTNAEVNSQRWKVSKYSNGKFFLQNAYTGKYLSASGNNAVQLNSYNSSSMWTFVPADTDADCYYIVSNTGLYLRKPLDTEGSPIILSDKNEHPKEMGQVWKFVLAKDETNEFTASLRDEIVNAWKDKFYMPASFSPAFKIGSKATGHVIERPGFWDTAENMEILLDAYETIGSDEYRIMYNEVFDNFVATQYVNHRNQYTGEIGWKANDFNDDLAWLIIGMVRAHLLFGDEGRDYKALAKEYFDFVYDRALLPQDDCAAGLLRWLERNKSTNSCVNGPMEVAACYLAIATGDDSYYTKAKDLYTLQRQYLTRLPEGIGHVYDDWDCTRTNPYNTWASTYNQGTFLGAAVMLYKRYGDSYEGKPTTYKEDAAKVIDYTMGNNFCENGIIKVCQSDVNLVGFKGILMRYVRKYIEEMPNVDVDKYKNWMIKNVLHAYNNRNSQSLTWSAWLEKSDEANFRPYFEEEKLAHQIYGAFGTGTIVSAAVNIPYVEPTSLVPAKKESSDVVIFAVGDQVFINTGAHDPINKIAVYDLQGRLLMQKEGLNSSQINFHTPVYNNVVIIQVQTKGSVANQKLILK